MAGRRGLLAGHMARALSDIRQKIRLADLVIEVADARAPYVSRNPSLISLLNSRKHLLVLNKADLAESETTDRWLNYFTSQGIEAVTFSSIPDQGASVNAFMHKVSSYRTAKNRKRPVALVVGTPNVGKSSLINRLSGRGAARTGARPGVTRGKQWVSAGDIDLLDTPGVLPPHVRNHRSLIILSLIGALEPDSLMFEELAVFLIETLRERNPRWLEVTYSIEDERAEPVMVLEEIGRRRGCLAGGGKVDTHRTASLLLKDFRAGRLGNLSLEDPSDVAQS